MKTHLTSTKKRRFALIAGVVAGLLAPFAVSSGSVSAAGASYALTWRYTAGGNTAVKGIQVSGWERQRVYAAITTDQPTAATVAITKTTDLTLAYGYSSYTGSQIAFIGTQEAVNAALDTLTLAMPASATSSAVKIKTTFFKDSEGLAYNPQNQHFYRFVPGKISGTNAFASAATLKEFGLTGYLASVTSADENNFISAKIEGAKNVWIGASDSVKEGEWKWIGGPDDAKQFWSGNCTKVDGKLVDGLFAQWATGEPNNYITGTNKCGGTAYDINSTELGEDCVVTNWDVSGVVATEKVGYWNDVPCSLEVNWDRTPIGGYVVEFGTKTEGSTYDSNVDIKEHTLIKYVATQSLQPTPGKAVASFVSVVKKNLSKKFLVFTKKLKTKLTQAQIIPCPQMEKTRFSLTLRTTDPGNYYFYFAVPRSPQSSQLTRAPVQCGSKVGKTVIPEPIGLPRFKTKKAGETITVTAYLETWRLRDRDGYPQVRVIRGDYLRGGGGQIIDQPNPPLPGMPIK